MKLAYLSPAVTHPPVGSAVHAHQITSRLAQAGLEIAVLSLDPNPQYKKFDLTARGLADMLQWADAIYVRANPNIEEQLLPHLPALHKPVFWEINAPIEEGLWLARLSRRWPVPWSSRDEWRQLYYGGKQKRVRRQFARYVQAAFCVSKAMGDYARQLCPQANVTVVPNGSDPQQFDPAKRDRSLFPVADTDFVITWAGSADWAWQGIPQILAVAETAQQQFSAWKFALFCDRQHLPAKLPTNIIHTGKVPYFEFPRYLASTDIGLSLVTGVNQCPWGNYLSQLKFFDYLASALAVVATDSGQGAEIVRQHQCGELTDDTPQGLLEALSKITREKTTCRAMGVNGRRAVIEHYTWERAARDTLAVIQACMGDSPNPVTKR